MSYRRPTRETASLTAGRRGFSLLELMITLAVLTVMMAPMVSIFFQSEASFRAQDQESRLIGQMRIAMDQITRCLRQAGNEPVSPLGVPAVVVLGDGHIQLNTDITGAVASTTGNSAESTGDPDGTLGSIYEVVTFRHDRQQKALYADIGYGEELLAQNIGDLRFTFMDLTGIPTSDPSKIAQVRVWMMGESEEADMQMGQLYTITLRSDVFIRSRTPQILPE